MSESVVFNWDKVNDTYNELDNMLVKAHDEKHLTFAEMLTTVEFVKLHIYQQYINNVLKDEIEERLSKFIDEKLGKVLRGIEEDDAKRASNLGMIG